MRQPWRDAAFARPGSSIREEHFRLAVLNLEEEPARQTRPAAWWLAALDAFSGGYPPGSGTGGGGSTILGSASDLGKPVELEHQQPDAQRIDDQLHAEILVQRQSLPCCPAPKITYLHRHHFQFALTVSNVRGWLPFFLAFSSSCSIWVTSRTCDESFPTIGEFEENVTLRVLELQGADLRHTGWKQDRPRFSCEGHSSSVSRGHLRSLLMQIAY